MARSPPITYNFDTEHYRRNRRFFYIQIILLGGTDMEFFTSAVSTLQTFVIALGAGLAVWGVINLLEGYGSDNPGANAQGP
jgi:hypothetical protein